MKKFVLILICLLLLSLAIPAFAAGVTVTFTADSLPEVGGTLTVDKNALMNNGSITSDMYNALLDLDFLLILLDEHRLKEVEDFMVDIRSSFYDGLCEVLAANFLNFD